MEHARIDRAVNRIEAALDRIEAADPRPAAAGGGSSADGSSRDGVLETRVRSALGQLDALIESLEK